MNRRDLLSVTALAVPLATPLWFVEDGPPYGGGAPLSTKQIAEGWGYKVFIEYYESSKRVLACREDGSWSSWESSNPDDVFLAFVFLQLVRERQERGELV